MDGLGTIAQWMAFGVSLLSVGLVVYNSVFSAASARADKVSEAVESNRGRLDRHEARIAAIEADLRHIPSADAFADLRVGQEGIRGDLKELAASIRPLTSIAERWQDFMQENSK